MNQPRFVLNENVMKQRPLYCEKCGKEIVNPNKNWKAPICLTCRRAILQRECERRGW